MSWVCELTEDAKKDLGDVPKAIQKRVVFRRRLGDYRLLFTADREKESCTSFAFCCVPAGRIANLQAFLTDQGGVIFRGRRPLVLGEEGLDFCRAGSQKGYPLLGD